jgi:hypothetical protein
LAWQAVLSTSLSNSMVVAGEEVKLCFTLRDCFGNASEELTGRALDVQVFGPGQVTFAAAGSSTHLRCVLSRST